MTGKRFRLRAATAADAGPIAGLVQAYWAFENITGFDATAVTRELERFLENPALGSGWIATDSAGNLVGYLLGVYVFSLENLGMTAEIDEFFVLPDFRGAGLGEKLLARAEAGFRHAGCTCVSLQVGNENFAARSFYLRHGYATRSGFGLLEKALA